MRPLTAALAALLCLAAPLAATPTRLLTVDNGSMIVPDDWDAAYYYSLAPNFKGHMYLDAYSDGKALGWAFLDVRVGTLVLWWNKPYEAAPLFEAAAAGGAALGGLTGTAFSQDVLNAWEPKERRVQAPDTKVAVGYALPLGDGLSLGLCFRLAQLDQRREEDVKDASGSPLPLGAAGSSAQFMGSGGFAALDVARYASSQASRGMLVSPQFSWQAESYTLDAKADLLWNGVENVHTEELVGAGDSGSLRQSLKDKGRLSWAVKPKLRWMLDRESSLVLRGAYGVQDLSLEHRLKGEFSGSGLSAAELGGWDFKDYDQEMQLLQWEALAGWVKSWDKGRSLVVLGLGARGQEGTLAKGAWAPKDASVSYAAVYQTDAVEVKERSLSVPLVIGAEIGVAPWLKARGMASRSLYTQSSTRTQADSLAASGALLQRRTTLASSDLGPAWTLAAGLGLELGQFSWDMALNTGLLGAPTGAAFVNPLYQSSFSYAF